MTAAQKLTCPIAARYDLKPDPVAEAFITHAVSLPPGPRFECHIYVGREKTFVTEAVDIDHAHRIARNSCICHVMRVEPVLL